MSAQDPTSTPLRVCWETFRLVIPADAPPTQIKEMRRAFYAGSLAVFALMVKASDSEDEEVGMRMMTKIDNEIRTFNQGIGSDPLEN